MSDNLDAIFYNPDHTKTYSPSGKPTGVVMTDFDIMEAKQAIEDLYAEKLEAFAEEVEEAIGEEIMCYDSTDISHKFMGCDTCQSNMKNHELRQALKAIKGKAGIE